MKLSFIFLLFAIANYSLGAFNLFSYLNDNSEAQFYFMISNFVIGSLMILGSKIHKRREITK